MNTEEKTIYDLKLHESIDVGNHTTATRVPGGWIYEHYDVDAGLMYATTFVPWDSEFCLGPESRVLSRRP